MSAIDFDDLPPDVKRRALEEAHRKRAEKVGPDSPLKCWDEKRAKNAKRGAQRQATGRSLEDEFSIVHQLYQLQGVAEVERIGPPVQYVRTNRGPELKAVAKAPGDYFGTVEGLGGVLFDVKALKAMGAAFRADDESTAHQAKRMLAHGKKGLLTFFLLVDRAREYFYLVRTAAALTAIAGGGAVPLRERKTGITRAMFGTPEAFTHLQPWRSTPGGLLVRQDEPRWDWLALLTHELRKDPTPNP